MTYEIYTGTFPEQSFQVTEPDCTPAGETSPLIVVFGTDVLAAPPNEPPQPV